MGSTRKRNKPIHLFNPKFVLIWEFTISDFGYTHVICLEIWVFIYIYISKLSLVRYDVIMCTLLWIGQVIGYLNNGMFYDWKLPKIQTVPSSGWDKFIKSKAPSSLVWSPHPGSLWCTGRHEAKAQSNCLATRFPPTHRRSSWMFLDSGGWKLGLPGWKLRNRPPILDGIKLNLHLVPSKRQKCRLS